MADPPHFVHVSGPPLRQSTIMARYLFLEKFNNYFNRKVIKYDTIVQYMFASGGFKLQSAIVNFKPNDNVSTEIIDNDVGIHPDYLLVLSDDATEILSRWFIMETVRTREKQYRYILRRDVIVDNLDSLESSPIFVQKAWLDENNSLILNDEGMSFNRIKRSETLLKDFSGSAWYVAYLSKNKGGAQIDLQIPAGEVEGSVTLSDIADEIGISEAYLASLLNFNGDQVNPARFVNSLDFHFWTWGVGSGVFDYRFGVGFDYKIEGVHSTFTGDTSGDEYPLFNVLTTPAGNNLINSYIRDAVNNHKTALRNQLTQILNVPYLLDTDKLNILRNYQGKYVLYLGKYYKLNIVISGTSSMTHDSYFPYNKYSSLEDIALEVNSRAEGNYYLNTSGGYLSFSSNADNIYIQLNEVSDDPNIPVMDLAISSARKQTLDQQFDIICFPANDVEFELKDENDQIYTFTSIGEICRKMVTKLGIQEDANVYDIQLLPYCPLDKIIELYDLAEGKDYNLIKGHNDPTKLYGTVFYIPSANFQQRLDYSLTIKESMKMDNECDLYRIIAPNYQGVFEFNIAKNGGTVNFFTAYCTYKPYTPFIKVTPDFQYVYGSDYNDDRGLICSGDFSMPRVNSAWESYQLQNKNYQNIFNRDIQNLEIMQGIERRQHEVTGGLGIFTDALKGAVAGGVVSGSPWGAAIGGVLGAGASAAGYLMDKDIMAIQHREQRSLAVDKFNYQLGNIKALPYTITKVGSFDISSKIFPVLVYYTCTDKEREAMRLKLKYESMTVMKVGYFGDFYNRFDEPKYFKGELIRCDDLAEDNHMLEAIYSELLKGVYM